MSVSLFSVVFGAMGMLMAGVGVVLFVKTRRFLATASRAPAIVVEHEERRESDLGGTGRTYFYYPVVEFKDAGGIPHRVTMDLGSRPKPYQDGARVIVLYDPQDPEKAKIEAFTDLWLWSLILSVTGAVFIAFSLAKLFGGIR